MTSFFHLPQKCLSNGLALCLCLLFSAELIAAGKTALKATELEKKALQIEGQWRQGHVLRGLVPKGSSARFMGRELVLGSDGRFLVGLDRDAKAEVVLDVISPSKQVKKYHFAVEPRDYDIQRIEGIKKKHMSPSDKELKRIWRENAAIKKSRLKHRDIRAFEEDFQWPVLGRISGVYGSQRYYNGQPRRPHYGVDVAKPTGTPVKAPASGIVTFANGDTFYAGGLLIIDHGFGLSSSFLHLSKLLVKEGERVQQGDLIAEIGATGRVTGPHLDWRMNWFKQRVDPTLLVPAMAEMLSKSSLKP